MALRTSLYFMLILILITTSFLVIMLEKWSEQSLVCHRNRPGWDETDDVFPESEKNTNSKCKCPEPDPLADRTALSVEKVPVKEEASENINSNSYKDSPDLKSRLKQLKQILEKLEKNEHIDKLDLNIKELKEAQETVGDVISLVDKNLSPKHLSPFDKDFNHISKVSLKHNTTKLDVCPEKYNGSTWGYPFFYEGFVTMKCENAKPFQEVISGVLNFVNYEEKYKPSIIKTITKFTTHYPDVPLLVAVSDKMFDSKSVESLPAKVEIVQQSQAEGVIWNRLIAQVKTPYTFVGRGLLNFNQDSRFVRLVRVISLLKVPIAGGAIKNEEGHWDMGCEQSVYKNYTLVYKKGYYHSQTECVLCSHINGPFVALTDFIQSYRFDENLNSKSLFADYLLTVSKANFGMVVCPDSMFYMQSGDNNNYQSSDWLPFAKKQNIQHIHFSNSQTLAFTCRMLNTNCGHVTGLGVPPCCMEVLAEQVQFFMTTCEKHGLICELQEGTLLGAVKFSKILPWERDADLTFHSSNFTALKNLGNIFQEGGHRLSMRVNTWCCVDGRVAGGVLDSQRSGGPSWNVEVWGQHLMDTEMGLHAGEPPTKVLLHGVWVNTPRNPGLYSRNRYGHEIYKHAQHWMSLRQRNSWELYSPGSFTPCPHPGQHNCLDQYHADGNIPFEVPHP